MNLKEIVSITGKSGLFKIISQTKNGVIVESLTDGKRFPAFVHDRMSSLEEISVFTTGEDRPLKDIFIAIRDKENSNKSIDPKSDNNTLKKYFEQIVPDYAADRVYVSDIKKMISWYNQLQEHNLLDFTEDAAPLPEESSTADSETV
jgi:hypothetical protein